MRKPLHIAAALVALAAYAPAVAAASEPATPQSWHVQVILVLGGKIYETIDYGKQTYSSADDCSAAVLADKALQAAAMKAAKSVGRDGGAVDVACVMELK